MAGQDPFAQVFQEWINVFMHRSMRRFIHYTRMSGLSMSMIGALFHLQQMESAGVRDLGEHLGVTSAAASQMLERLVQQGLIQRAEDPEDRRVKQITLTEKGCQVLKESIRARQGWLDDLTAQFSESEKAQLTASLKLMVEKAHQVE
jgi:DNA-binding MarR family transcriptional regulator